jgi:hypothetical protein
MFKYIKIVRYLYFVAINTHVMCQWLKDKQIEDINGKILVFKVENT